MKKMTLDTLKINSFLTGTDTRRLVGGAMSDHLASNNTTCVSSRNGFMCEDVSGNCQAA